MSGVTSRASSSHLVQLCNTLEPRLAPPVLRQRQHRATALRALLTRGKMIYRITEYGYLACTVYVV